MNPQQRQIYPMEYEDVRVLFQHFLESMSEINRLVQENNTAEEVDCIEGEIDRVLDIGDQVYCHLVGNDITLPDNYTDMDRVITEESRETGIPEPAIEMTFNEVLAEHEQISACAAWIKTRRRLERERQLRVISAGQTTTADWQVQ